MGTTLGHPLDMFLTPVELLQPATVPLILGVDCLVVVAEEEIVVVEVLLLEWCGFLPLFDVWLCSPSSSLSDIVITSGMGLLHWG